MCMVKWKLLKSWKRMKDMTFPVAIYHQRQVAVRKGVMGLFPLPHLPPHPGGKWKKNWQFFGFKTFCPLDAPPQKLSVATTVRDMSTHPFSSRVNTRRSTPENRTVLEIRWPKKYSASYSLIIPFNNINGITKEIKNNVSNNKGCRNRIEGIMIIGNLVSHFQSTCSFHALFFFFFFFSWRYSTDIMSYHVLIMMTIITTNVTFFVWDMGLVILACLGLSNVTCWCNTIDWSGRLYFFIFLKKHL